MTGDVFSTFATKHCVHIYIYIYIDRAAFGNSFADDQKRVPTLGFSQTFF